MTLWKKLVVLTLPLLLITLPGIALAETNPNLAEPRELDGSQPAIGNVSGQIILRSPLRQGDTSSGTDNWVTINSSFNNPRTSGMHKGFDLESKDLSGNGRPVFSTWSGSVTANQWVSGYGNTLTLGHQYRDPSGQTYYFKTFYAHLASASPLSVGTPVTDTTLVGTSGNTGGTYPIHLHFETQMYYSTGSDGLNRKYPPSFFYYANTSTPLNWGNNSSFINRLPGDYPNQIKFRLVDMNNGSQVVGSNPTLWVWDPEIKVWTSYPLNATGDPTIFVKDMGSLGYPAGTGLLFYVGAQSNTWDPTTYYWAYRPYRYSALNSPPTDQPFSFTVQ